MYYAPLHTIIYPQKLFYWDVHEESKQRENQKKSKKTVLLTCSPHCPIKSKQKGIASYKQPGAMICYVWNQVVGKITLSPAS
jgi:hypothetical protein